MKLRAFLVLLFVLFNSCVFHSVPGEYQAPYYISRMSELEGVYKNKGDPSGALSQIFWGDMNLNVQPKGIHKDIQLIEIVADNNILNVKAIQGRCVLREKVYINGRDFEIHDGEIVIYRHFSPLTGDAVIGPSYRKVTLGLDAGKHGKYRDSSIAAVLGMMIVPALLSGTTDIRFERVKDKPLGFKACKKR